MAVLSRRRVPALTLLAAAFFLASVAASGVARAQKDKDKGKSSSSSANCSVDQSSPTELVTANLFLSKAQAAKNDTAEATKNLQQAVAQLTGKNAKINNPSGRNYVLARAYIGLVDRPGSPTIAPRGQFGFKDDPSTPYDLVAGVDTLARAIAAANPACAQQAMNMREHVYVPLVNQGITLLNAKQYDSAQAVATRAQQVYPEGPYSYYIMATAALQKKDLPSAAAQYQKALDAIGSDTTYAKLKPEVTYNQAIVYQQMAAAATGPEKADDAKKAAADFKAVLDQDPNNSNAKVGYAAALAASGDTAALVTSYGEKLANPDKYTAIQLFQAGITAVQTKHLKDADSLFTLGLVKNPYFPDAVLYVANNAFNAKELDKLTPLAKRLVELTPNSPDAYRLMAGQFQLHQHASKTPAAQHQDADSTLKYYQKYKELPIEVTITQFDMDSAGVAVAGTVNNHGTAAKPATLTFSLLNTEGAVVTTQTVPAMTVPPGGSQPFSFKASGTGIAGYKYAPVN
jgi:tetratricopeptide (TPR) repeat protein